MTAGSLVLIAVAGGIGAALRFVVDTAVVASLAARRRRPFPLGTVVVNVSGCFAIGVVAGLTAGAALPAELTVILATGLLGGYTTFSAASVDAVRLAQEGRPVAAAAYASGLLISSTVAAAVGQALATLLLIVL